MTTRVQNIIAGCGLIVAMVGAAPSYIPLIERWIAGDPPPPSTPPVEPQPVEQVALPEPVVTPEPMPAPEPVPAPVVNAVTVPVPAPAPQPPEPPAPDPVRLTLLHGARADFCGGAVRASVLVQTSLERLVLQFPDGVTEREIRVGGSLTLGPGCRLSLRRVYNPLNGPDQAFVEYLSDRE